MGDKLNQTNNSADNNLGHFFKATDFDDIAILAALSELVSLPLWWQYHTDQSNPCTCRPDLPLDLRGSEGFYRFQVGGWEVEIDKTNRIQPHPDHTSSLEMNNGAVCNVSSRIPAVEASFADPSV